MSWPPFDSPCLTPPTESPAPLGPCLHCQIRHLAVCGVLTPAEVQAMDAVASLQAGMEIEMPLRLRRAREAGP